MIRYITGDATNPIGDDNRVIVHICNNVGAWGAGFVIPLGNKYPKTKQIYKQSKSRVLGDIQLINVENNVYVVNMIAQDDVVHVKNQIPLRYDALRICLKKVVQEIPAESSIHMPRIGCGLAGGKWIYVEKIIKETIPDHINVFVYDLK